MRPRPDDPPALRTKVVSNAEELAQDVFMKAYFALKRFQRRSKFRTWLQRIKVNHCLNHLKKSGGLQAVELDEGDAGNHENLRTEPRAWLQIDGEAERERIAAVLDEMSDTLRIPLILRDMDDMSYQEIADALGTGLSAVKMRIKRAREVFRELYEAAS